MRAVDLADERQLVQRMLDGDERAFHAFFDEYFARLYRFTLPRLNGDATASQEVVQATLEKAMRALDGFRGEAAMFTWLCGICRRQIVDYLRAHRRYADNVVLVDDQPELRAALDAIEAPSQYDAVRSYSEAETRRLV